MVVGRFAQVTPHATPGRHILADFRGVPAALLADAAALERELVLAAEAAGARVLGAHFHHFGEGAGVTGVVMLSESHISVHSWPEHRFAALDIFMCGAARPELALERLRAALGPDTVRVTTVERG
nr:adenosylmethionine decarboxylase [Achromobacter xylosoxidans]